MRRGHPGIGGWRNENTRHFRPRSGGTPHFRPPRNYGILDSPRFPPLGPRSHRPPPSYNNHRGSLNHGAIDHHDRNKYRNPNRSSNQRLDREHQGPRPNFPLLQRLRHEILPNKYLEQRNFYDDFSSEQCLVNSMGDVDHRQLNNPPHKEPFSYHHIWTNPDHNKSYYDDENNGNKLYRRDSGDGNKLPVSEYIGHRPPASDHYGGIAGTVIDDSNSFSRSVDDTVDIIRKRLLNRNESHQHSSDQQSDQVDGDQDVTNHDTSNFQNSQETPTKRRVQRSRQSVINVKKNCDTIKNKIVHQLFKMDKDKIHKLMDNPNSSTKFEYAISSLITESQNSLNRHLRSVAEKSLTSSSDFIHNDNNTIYEDTFMKQMQCILDPQDSVFLEDIKPLVMAELSKVLQIDDYYDQQHDTTEEQNIYHQRADTYDQFSNDEFNCGVNEFTTDQYTSDITQPPSDYPPSIDLKNAESRENINEEYNTIHYDTQLIYERRSVKTNCDRDQDRRMSMEQRRLSRMSMDNRSTDPTFPSTEERHMPCQSTLKADGKNQEDAIIPLFDSNAEQFSEDDDPFAELDQQYHVAVDHTFIETYDSSPQPSICRSRSKSPTTVIEETTKQLSPEKNFNIKKEIDDQLLSFAKSPLKLTSNNNDVDQKCKPTPTIQIKQENHDSPTKKADNNDNMTSDTSNANQDQFSQQKEMQKQVDNSENVGTMIKTSTPSSTRKRSLDQKPSHRKEKRKKCDSGHVDASKQMVNKNIVISVNDCVPKKHEKVNQAAQSIFNLYFAKDQHDKGQSKDCNKSDSADKTYSDKYVKRKEQPKTPKAKHIEGKKRHRSTSSSHSIVSPKESNTSISTQSIKSEAKSKFKNIDIFTEQHPRKISVHQAHRNTAPKTDKSTDENKIKLNTSTSQKVNKPPLLSIKKRISKETQTIDIKKCITRFSQTERKKFVVKAIQTDPVVFEKTGLKSTDAFERMKEIDLEIQMLLQEKFKLYSSLESKDPSTNTMQTLGMTVLNVSNYEEDKEHEAETASLSEDAIVDDFTNIPVEELEQIALETVQEVTIETTKIDKRNRRQKVLEKERLNSESPSNKRNTKKAKAPNISLIEQIITDDRPLEDIISLDDLESSPVRSKQKTKNKKVPKKKVTKKMKVVKPVSNKNFQLKECSVLLARNAIEMYFKNKTQESPSKVVMAGPKVIVESIVPGPKVIVESVVPETPVIENTVEPANEQESNIIEETVVNDLDFDMLDVSEDIVIGDNCEIKSNGDKERLDMPINEEIILDNSQSSMEDVSGIHLESGPNDNHCKTYDYSTDEKLRRDCVTVTGNADAVLALECVDNNFLAACLDGNVYYFNGDGQLITTLRGSNLAVTCLTIVKEKYETTVYTGSLDSRIRYYDLETGLEKGPECNVLSPIQTMDRAWDTVFVGTRTGFVLQFECKNNMLIPVSTVKFSEQSILALRAMKEGPRKVLLVAARSEDVTIKDAQTGLLLRTLVGPKMTVYTLLYEDGKVFCGTSSHQIHVFDYASGSHVGAHEGGKGAVCLRATGGLVFAGCYDGCVYVYREGEPQPLAQLRGPSLMLLSLAVVGSKIIVGYKDRGLYIWKIPLNILQEMIL